METIEYVAAARNAHYRLSKALTKAGRPEEALAASRIAEDALAPRPGDRSEPQKHALLHRRHSTAAIALRGSARGLPRGARDRPHARIRPMPTWATRCFSSTDTPRLSNPWITALILIKAAPSLKVELADKRDCDMPSWVRRSRGSKRREAEDEYFRRALELHPHNMDTN